MLFLNNYRFRRYFIRVLMFIPRLFCGRNIGKNWEDRTTNHTIEIRHVNGVSNFNSQVSNTHRGMAHSQGYTTSRFSPNESALGRSRSMQCAASENQDRDTVNHYTDGNSLLPHRISRVTAGCVSANYKLCRCKLSCAIK